MTPTPTSPSTPAELLRLIEERVSGCDLPECPQSAVEFMWHIAEDRSAPEAALARQWLTAQTARQRYDGFVAAVANRLQRGFQDRPGQLPFALQVRFEEIANDAGHPCSKLAQRFLRSVRLYYERAVVPRELVRRLKALARHDDEPGTPLSKVLREYADALRAHSRLQPLRHRRSPLNPARRSFEEDFGPVAGPVIYDVWPAMHVIVQARVLERLGITGPTLIEVQNQLWFEALLVNNLSDFKRRWTRQSTLTAADDAPGPETNARRERVIKPDPCTDMARAILAPLLTRQRKPSDEDIDAATAYLRSRSLSGNPISRTYIPTLDDRSPSAFFRQSLWRELKPAKRIALIKEALEKLQGDAEDLSWLQGSRSSETFPRVIPASSYRATARKLENQGREATRANVVAEWTAAERRRKHRSEHGDEPTLAELAKHYGLHDTAVRRAAKKAFELYGSPPKNGPYHRLSRTWQARVLESIPTRAFALGLAISNGFDRDIGSRAYDKLRHENRNATPGERMHIGSLGPLNEDATDRLLQLMLSCEKG